MATSRRSILAISAALLAAVLLTLAAAGIARAAPGAQVDPTAEPSPTVTATPSPTAEATPTPAPSPTAEATPAPAPSATEPAAAPAQTVSLAIDKTLVGSDVVKVGQYLTFTIRITNTGSAVVTDLPLVDEYATAILQPDPGRTTPPPTSSTPGELRWADLTTTFGDLAPGQSVEVTTVFRAIRVDDEVINRARVETGLGTGGGGGGPVEDQDGGTVEGGSVTVAKELVPSFIDTSNPVISFTMTLRNDGYTDIVRAPLVDTYRADLLRFLGASVPPDAHNPATGELRWNDILAGLGVTRLRPGETVAYTATYLLLAPVDNLVVNSFDAVDVADEFGNRVASPRRAEVRIRVTGIGDQPTATATLAPTPEEEARRPRSTPTATPAPAAPSATVTAEATPAAGMAPADTTATPAGGAPAPGTTPGDAGEAAGGTGDTPTTLPATGAARPAGVLWPLGVLALVAGLALRGAARRRRP